MPVIIIIPFLETLLVAAAGTIVVKTISSLYDKLNQQR